MDGSRMFKMPFAAQKRYIVGSACLAPTRTKPSLCAKVDMIDAAAMRNLATPAQLEACAQAGGGAAGKIKVIPIWETSSVLVLAPGEETLESAVGKVVSRR